MYTTTDPRSTLQNDPPKRDDGTAIAPPAFADFTRTDPAETTDAGSRTWVVRGQNVVLAYTSAVAGDRFPRTGDEAEYVVLAPHDDSAVSVRASEAETALVGQGMIVVPPGPSVVETPTATDFVRLFVPGAGGIADRAANAADYDTAHPRVSIEDPWPEPVGGYALRTYPVGDIGRSPDRFGRILRTRSFMVNFLFPYEGPRDATKLSPHHHDDFEQLSLAVAGEFVHHIRTPWSTSRLEWRDDDHEHVSSPSLAVIPPPTEHTSEAVGAGHNQLFDVFAPPRTDFSAKPGWVLNADTYPMP